MNYKYRITLSGIKGFFRVYVIDGGNSLYRFHKQIRSDLEFPVDQPILFKALNGEGQVVARYALMDIGYGAVDSVTVADTVKAGVESFIYFYDIESRKSVIITLEGESDMQVAGPRLVESKGPVPLEFENGYVAFEDLPDDRRRASAGAGDDDEDDDDDEDFSDDEKDEEEIIYEDETAN